MNSDETKEIPLEEILELLHKKCDNAAKVLNTYGLYECTFPVAKCSYIVYWGGGFYCMRESWKKYEKDKK